MYLEYIILTASISMAYLIIFDDLVVFTCSNICFCIFLVFLLFKLPVHTCTCWTNETTLAVKKKKKKYRTTMCSCRKHGDIVLFQCIVQVLDIVPVSLVDLSCIEDFFSCVCDWVFF